MKLKIFLRPFAFLFLLILWVSACTDSKKFEVKSGLNISVEITDVQNGKAVKNSMLVTAKAILPSGVTNAQIKASALDIIKRLKQEYPKCEWFTILMSDDNRSFQSGNYIGIAEFREGKTSITGGVPSDAEIAEYRSWKIGPIMKPTDEGKNIFLEFAKIKQAAHLKGRYLSDTEIYPILSKKFNLPIAKVKEIHRGIGKYYMYKQRNDLNKENVSS